MILTGNMFDNNKKLSLVDILQQIPDNALNWYLFEINAVGVAPNGLSMVEFEKKVSTRENGYKFSWLELEEFAKNITDINDLILISSKHPISFSEINQNSVDIYVEIFDSEFWTIMAQLW